MTKRTLPAASGIAARISGATELSPAALARWNPGLRMQGDGQADGQGDDADAPIAILGIIGQDWFGEGTTAKTIETALAARAGRDVAVQINSPGGDYFEGLAIYNLLREHAGAVTVKVLGLAASAASVVAMAGDRVEVARAGFLMIHNAWVLGIGDRHALREIADTLEPFDQVAAEIYAARSGQKLADIARMMDRETWINGSQAVEKGFADDLLPSDQVTRDARAALVAAPQAAAHRLDLLLAKAGVARSERRQLIRTLKNDGTRNAADGTPGAADPPAPATVAATRDLEAALAGLRNR